VSIGEAFGTPYRPPIGFLADIHHPDGVDIHSVRGQREWIEAILDSQGAGRKRKARRTRSVGRDKYPNCRSHAGNGDCDPKSGKTSALDFAQRLAGRNLEGRRRHPKGSQKPVYIVRTEQNRSHGGSHYNHLLPICDVPNASAQLGCPEPSVVAEQAAAAPQADAASHVVGGCLSGFPHTFKRNGDVADKPSDYDRLVRYEVSERRIGIGQAERQARQTSRREIVSRYYHRKNGNRGQQ
jgi:hypothetical protein